MGKDEMSELMTTIKDVKSTIEYESRFSLEHRNWMVDRVKEIKEDIKGINGRVRKTEVSVGWIKGVGVFIGGIISWLVKKQV